MFKKSRMKIVAAIMSVLVLVWAGMLGVIYASSYFKMSEQNEEMLKIHADRYMLLEPENAASITKPMPDNEKHGLDRELAASSRFELSTFYTVAFSYDGEILEIKNASPMVYTDEELQRLAYELIEQDGTVGKENNLIFYKTDKGGYLLVTFMDNTVINEGAATLLWYTLLFGGLAFVIFFFFAVFLARKIVQPLEESYQKQKQFVSDAGHELKTPVAVVSANAELLSREIGANQWLSNIQYENERMGKLIGQLLELAHAEHAAPQRKQLDFGRLVMGEILPFESVAFEKGLVLCSDISDGITVEGNSTQLKQLVSILLDNAISHSSGGSDIHVKLTKEHHFARLSVVNQGDAISKEQSEHLFDRFYRVDEARTGETHHYGLGLAIAKTIVSAHKGKIDVSCREGLVEFLVLLPKTES